MKTTLRFNCELLRKCRKERRWTQEQVAYQLGIDARTLRAYETGEVNAGGFSITRDVGSRLDDMTTLFKLEGGTDAWLVSVPDVPEASEAERRAPCHSDVTRLTFTHPHLYGRDDDLYILERAWQKHVRVIALIGWGGMGKSSLVATWVARLSESGYPGLNAVFAWAFYARGADAGSASADRFFEEALTFFGDSAPHSGTSEGKGQRLAALLQAQRTLLILDGVDSIQSPRGATLGQFEDVALRTLLLQLASSDQRKCLTIITSRLGPSDLAAFADPAVVVHELKSLSRQSGRELLASLGVHGQAHDLEDASDEFRGHPLTLHLLGQYVQMACDNDIRQRLKQPQLLSGARGGGPARGVLEAYRRWFEEGQGAELEVLWLISLFDRPARREAIDALLADDALKGLTSHLGGSKKAWGEAVDNLRRLWLLSVLSSGRTQTIDVHPLVREYFGDQFRTTKPDAWKRGHSVLFDHFTTVAPDQPVTLEEMEPLFVAIRHGILANRIADAFQMSGRRIVRYKEFYAARHLGAIGLMKECWTVAFEEPWTRVLPDIPPKYASRLYSGIGYLLKAEGRLAEARILMNKALELYRNAGRWAAAAGEGVNLTEIELMTGELKQSEQTIRDTSQLAQRIENMSDGQGGKWDGLMVRVGVLAATATLFHYRGDLNRAERGFTEAEDFLLSYKPRVSHLRSTWGYWYCDLLLDQRKAEEVLERSSMMLEWGQQNAASLRSLGLSKISLGKACLQLGQLDQAQRHLEGPDGALELLQRANQRHHLVDGLLAVTDLLTKLGIDHRFERATRFNAAERLLTEAMAIATTDGMRPYQIETLLRLATLQKTRIKLLRDPAHRQLAAVLRQTKEIIDAIGYERRRDDVHALLTDRI